MKKIISSSILFVLIHAVSVPATAQQPQAQGTCYGVMRIDHYLGYDGLSSLGKKIFRAVEVATGEVSFWVRKGFTWVLFKTGLDPGKDGELPKTDGPTLWSDIPAAQILTKYCVGQVVVAHKQMGILVDVNGPVYEPTRMAVVPDKAELNLSEVYQVEGTKAVIISGDSTRTEKITAVKLKVDDLSYLPLKRDQKRFEVKAGDEVSDCHDRQGQVQALFESPFDLDKSVAHIKFETGPQWIKFSDFCKVLASSEQVPARLKEDKKIFSSKVIMLKGASGLVVERSDGTPRFTTRDWVEVENF